MGMDVLIRLRYPSDSELKGKVMPKADPRIASAVSTVSSALAAAGGVDSLRAALGSDAGDVAEALLTVSEIPFQPDIADLDVVEAIEAAGGANVVVEALEAAGGRIEVAEAFEAAGGQVELAEALEIVMVAYA